MRGTDDEPGDRVTGNCNDCGEIFFLDEGHTCSGRR